MIIFRWDNRGITGRQSLFPADLLNGSDASTDGQSRITKVSRILLVSSANMTGLAKRLEKSGFIARKSDPKDEQVTLLEITSKGKTTLADIEAKPDQLLEKMLKGFLAKEKKELMILVRRLLRNIRQIG